MLTGLRAIQQLALLALAGMTVAPAVDAKAGDQPAGLAGFEDKGRFHLIKNKEQIGQIDFAWKPDGSYDNKCAISIAGQNITTHTVITPGADGIWERIEVDSPAGKAVLKRDGLAVKRTVGETEDEFQVKPGLVLFDNVGPALNSHLLMNYDQQRGGAQTLSLLIIPNVVFEAPLERLDDIERKINGQSRRFARYKLSFPGLDMTIWADEGHRLYLLDIPTQFAAFVREGYEALLESQSDDAVSAAEYEIRLEKNVRAPMRDGVELATDIYRPDAVGRFPVILVRTPYKKELNELQARFFARRGYVYAVQDCRGRFASDGEWEPFVHEPRDGYDAVEWLADQSWSSGKVGMIGASYLGWVQWWAASQNPPHLVTIIPSVSPPDPGLNFPSEAGVFFLWGAAFWMDVVESNATADATGGALKSMLDKDYARILRGLPVCDLDEALVGREVSYWRKWTANGPESDYWRSVSFLDRMKDAPIPVFHQSGWFDGDGIGTKINYARMKAYGHPHQKLVLGPWEHTDTATRTARLRDFGEAAAVDMQREYLRWFDYWLKGMDNGILEEPLVDLFVMGSNRWLHGNVYPLPETRFEKWYLSSSGGANTVSGDGKLGRDRPMAEHSADSYVYDPDDPTPDPTYIESGDDSKSGKLVKKERDAHYRQVVRARSDILVYTSTPLAEPLTIAGPLEAVLYATSSAPDTDWFLRVYEVNEAGEAFALTPLGGKVRARYRNSLLDPELLPPGGVQEYNIDLWQTAITIPAGNRLRVEIASAAFPLYSRNLNTGADNETDTELREATQTIFHDRTRPSHIVLPVIP